MDTFEAISKRKSVREFLDKPVEKDKLEKIIDAARRAPTARGEEPWEFIAVTGQGSIKELAGITDHGKFLANAKACVAIFCKDTKYYLEDGCAACENLLLAAASLGISACWIAGDKKPYAPGIAGALNVPSGFKLVSIVALGYSKDVSGNKKQRSLKEVLHWEKF